MPIINVICYYVKKPVVYNKGTPYECSSDFFLACYGYNDTDANIAYVNRLNSDIEEAKRFCEKLRIDFNTVKSFCHHQQEAFDTRGN